MTPANLVVAITLDPHGPAEGPALVHRLAAGDGTQAAMMLLAGLANARQIPGLSGQGLQYGFLCEEAVAFTDPGDVEKAATAALPDLPSQVLSLMPQVPRVFEDCAAWNVRRADPSLSTPTHSEVPALLLTGTLDAVTPPVSAKLAAQTLPNSRVIEVPGLGHGVRATSDCVKAVMGSFLDRPTGGYDTSCVEQLAVPPFETGP